MSSFVYEKQLFIEAAGFCAGLAAEKNVYREPLLRLYNYDAGRVFTDEDYYNTFSALFDMNAASVAAQYGDETPETDPSEYRETFDEAKQATRRAWLNYHCNGSDDVKKLIFKFSNFCDGILYQIEDSELSQSANFVINNVHARLFPILCRLSGYTMDQNTINGWSGLQIAEKM